MNFCSLMRIVFIILVLFPLGAANHVVAEPYAQERNKITNAQQAARLVKGRFGGKVLKVQRASVNGNPGYKVKVLQDNGHVKSVKVDAKSGRITGG